MEVTHFSAMIGRPFQLVEGKERQTVSAVAEDGEILFTAHKAAKRKVEMLYICSPLSAPTEPGIRRNMLYAQHYMMQASDQYGCRAVAPHAYLPELLDDHRPAERGLALSFGEKLLALCDALVICGSVISKGMAGEIALAVRMGKPILLATHWELDVEAAPAPDSEDIAMTLRSGKTLTQEEFEEVRETFYHLGDIDDVQSMLDSGVFDGDILFGPVPERCIPGIAERKAVLERQKGYSWHEAVEQALREWRDSEYTRLTAPSAPADLEIWKAIVPAAGEGQKNESEAGESNQ